MRFHANSVSPKAITTSLWLETEESDTEETDIIAAGVPFSLLTCSGPPEVGDQSITPRAERVEG